MEDGISAILSLVVLGAINHQITHIITTGVIFKECRDWVWATFGGKLGYLTTCHLCCGTWVGFAMALAVQDQFKIDDMVYVNYLAVAFVVSFAGRMWNEVWALASSQVSAIRTREACSECPT
jgi:hypothetical protein